jgi:ribonucleoside-diphosphate reductase alpha chain
MTVLTENGKVVLEKRIAWKDEDGKAVESPNEIFMRVAQHIASAETDEDYPRWVAAFYGAMQSLDFLPNSPCLVNAGKPNGQLSACFVLPVEDSINGIFNSVKNAALIHKTGGGTGFDFSKLRPDGSYVQETSGVASGPVSFMQVFDSATAAIKQGGVRRGANMGILRVDHPDILSFIRLKNDVTKMQNFNISVAITDEFLEALYAGREYELRDPRDGKAVGTAVASSIWTEITKGAHLTGDPGLIFIDRINARRNNPVPSFGPIGATNPCGEVPLYDYDSCNLGSINLANFVTGDRVEWGRLKDTVHLAVRFLDNVISVNNYPLPEIKERSNMLRRIGLGVMGWADMLFKLKIRYGSPESLTLASRVMEFISNEGWSYSRFLGMVRGPFPACGESIYKDTPVRNCTVTTIAPTGTIGIIAGASGGIEPNFELEFIRSHYLADDPNTRYEMTEYNPIYSEWLQEHPGMARPDYFVTAHEVTPMEHILMQKAFQEFTDNGVSKTINLPHDATEEDVRLCYEAAASMDLLGITVYRDGSKGMQVLRKVEKPAVDMCPDCNVELIHQEGCEECPNKCGFSLCSVA